MKKRVLVLIAVMAALLLVAGPVAAKATMTEFTGTETPRPIPVDPGTVTFPGGNIHIRGLVAVDDEVSDDPRMTGEATVYANANLDADGFGRLWGTWTLTPEPFEEGSWVGTFTGTFHADGSKSFRCVGDGRGAFEGLETMFTIEYAPGALVGQSSGRILDPHGQ